MIWPNIEESKKIKKIDLMNDGLDVSVQIDIHPKKPLMQVPDQRDQPQKIASPSSSLQNPSTTSSWHPSSVFGITSPFTPNRYLLNNTNTNTNNKNRKNANNHNISSNSRTPIRRNNSLSIWSSSSSSKRNKNQSNSRSSKRRSSSKRSLYSNKNGSFEYNDNDSFLSNTQSKDKEDQDEIDSCNHNNTISTPTHSIRRRFDSLRSTLSNLSSHHSEEEASGDDDENDENDNNNDNGSGRELPNNPSYDDGSSIDTMDSLSDFYDYDQKKGYDDYVDEDGYNDFDHITNDDNDDYNDADDNNNNNDDDDVGLIQKASILIDRNDGVITFQMTQVVMKKDDENENDNNDDDDAYYFHDDENNENGNNNEEEDDEFDLYNNYYRPMKQNSLSSSKRSTMMNDSKTLSSRSVSSRSVSSSGPTKNKSKSDTITNNNTYEMSSTTIQKDIDNEKKQFHSIRLACLEVAAEQYKKMNIEVPDIIVAQVNEHRHQLHEFQRNSNKSKDNLQKNGNENNNKKSTHNENMNDKSTSGIYKNANSSTKSINSSSSSRKQSTIQKRKRIRLRQSDEIHVAPCQCALSLVGMRGKFIMDDNTSVNESLFHNLLVPGKHQQRNNQQNQQIAQTTTIVEDATSNNQSMKSSLSKSSLKSIKLSKMVRTSSALVRNESQLSLPTSSHHNKSTATTKTITQHNDKSNLQKKPKQLSTHNRTDSGTFDVIGYHEITLIRNRDDNSWNKHFFRGRRGNGRSDSVVNEYNTDFLDWDAITIRCASHDELDMIVKALRDTSKAKVVPFSSNPKEKLKEKLKHEIMIQNRTRLLSDPSYHTYNGPYCQPIRHTDTTTTNATAAITPVQKHKASVTAISEDRPMFLKPSLSEDNQPSMDSDDNLSQHLAEVDNKPQPTYEKTKKKWDFNFNKKEYCEVCDLVFTLLTRRHHCRQCQRSICGNCSCMLLIKGGDEKRFCNSCSADILRKQSEAVRGRWKNRYSQSDKLPGKVHSACQKLGVGTIGKLPHWRNFLTMKINERPAVGRITIELLEAIALPSVNMLNAKVDPYVRATVTGYDRDMLWTLREWMPEKRYQLCSGYVSATLCPRWRGPGMKGGVLLTLPIISTAGAVLRLEVLDHNVMRNARGKDIVLGVVEIPLSDLPNANLRQPGGFRMKSNGEKKSLFYDGYCDRWYRLLSNDQVNFNSVILSKPIPSPHSEEASKTEKKSGAGMKSLEEIGRKVQGLCIQPIEWIASAIRLDLPARPEALYEEHKKRSMIHVRIKLNASVAGDVLSHAWFPPVVPKPPVPPFDPQILFARVLHVSNQLAPFRNIQQYVEKVIKWELEPKDCVRAYFVFAIHLMLLPYLVKIFHIYLFIFLQARWREMKAKDEENESDIGHIPHVDSMTSVDMAMQAGSGATNFQNSPSLTELTHNQAAQTVTASHDNISNEKQPNENEKEDAARLNIAVNWIAKRMLDNKGLEILQHKLGNLGRDLKNLNSVWNGSNLLLTQAAMVYLAISFVLHFIINPRLLWFMGTFTWYFGQSPNCVLCIRMFFGFWRGFAKGLRRQHLLDAEMLEVV